MLHNHMRQTGFSLLCMPVALRAPVLLFVGQVAYDITTSVAEAVEQMAALIKLTNYQTFTLYEATRPINFKLSPEPLPEEHMLLDENRYG